MPLARTTEAIEGKPQETNVQHDGSFFYDGIPADIARYFSIDLFNADPKVKSKLIDIYNWSKQDLMEDTIGNNLHKISVLDSRLGTSMKITEKFDKIWNWVRLDRNINELRKRQQAFEG